MLTKITVIDPSTGTTLSVGIDHPAVARCLAAGHKVFRIWEADPATRSSRTIYPTNR